MISQWFGLLQFGEASQKFCGNPSLLRCLRLGTLKPSACQVSLENSGLEDFTHLFKYTTIQLHQRTLQLFADFHNPAAVSRYSLHCTRESSQASESHSLTNRPQSLEERWAAWWVLRMGIHRPQLWEAGSPASKAPPPTPPRGNYNPFGG